MKDLMSKMNELKENKNGKVVTFDFDNTIAKSFENSLEGDEIQYQFGGINHEIIKRIKKFKSAGFTVFVVSARWVSKEVPESSIQTMLDELNIDVDGIFYTNGDVKAQKLYELGSSLHYDDDPKEHEAVEAFSKLHDDFRITMKYPDELISDIEEIAKGLIMTSDNKFLIAQRSDSYEWDAAGGHLMQGETAPFAFWREVREEMGIEIKNVQYMDTRETYWQGKKKDVHYFLAYIELTCEELKGAIDLQWELADYFCGDIREIDQKLNGPDGSTQNLKNAVEIFLNQGDLLLEVEKFQQKMIKKHSKMKKRILGLGKNRKPPATGMENVSDMSRSKSAPPIGAALGESNQTEIKKKIKIKIVSDLDEKKKRKKRKKKRKTRRSYGIGWPFIGYGGSRETTDSDGGGDGGGE